jgi:hypothetical protein
VNVLQAPPSKPAWIRVQPRDRGNASPPGYVRTTDLGNWSTLALWLTFRPDDAAASGEKAAYVAGLEQALAHTPDSADAKRANLRIAEECVALARDARRAGQGSGLWLDRADRALRSLRADREFGVAAGELSRNLQALRRPASRPPRNFEPAKKRAEPYNPDPDFHLAESDWQAGRYASAERRLKHILKLSPEFGKAARLLEKVRKAQSVDPGVC